MPLDPTKASSEQHHALQASFEAPIQEMIEPFPEAIRQDLQQKITSLELAHLTSVFRRIAEAPPAVTRQELQQTITSLELAHLASVLQMMVRSIP